MARTREEDSVNMVHPSVQWVFVAYGAGAILAGVVTHAMSLGDVWPLLGNGAGALIAAGALGLVRRTLAMKARVGQELELRRQVLVIGTLAAALGVALFMLSIARWQTDLVPATALAMAAAVGLVNLTAAWRAVLRLASYLEPPAKPAGESHDGDGEQGGG